MASGTLGTQHAAKQVAVGALLGLTVVAAVAVNLVVLSARRTDPPELVASAWVEPGTATIAPTTTLPPVVMTVVEHVPIGASGSAAAPSGGGPAAGATAPPATAGSAPGPGSSATPTTPATAPPTTATPPPTTAAPMTITQPGTYTTSAGPAGSVIVQFNGTTVSAQPIQAAGWTAYSEGLQGDEVKIEYRSDDQRKIVWEAKVEGGVLRVTWKVD
jgi:hypothetical protein